MQKIGFIYINKSYCVYHSLGIAIELAKNAQVEVVILSTKANESLIKSLIPADLQNKLAIKILRPYWYITIPHYFEIKLQLRPTLFYKYSKLFASFDSLVCTIYEDLFIKKVLPKSVQPKLIFTNHGIPNRSYSFDERALEFDMLCLLGKREKSLRKSINHLRKNNHVITGFLKYDLVKDRKPKQYFKNDKPVIFYNPHWLSNFSSFHKFGFELLDYFARQNTFNLIFAPHTLLLERNWDFWWKIRKYEQHDHFLIDYGSESSNNMDYTKSADLYLGDISSQAFEFIYYKKRPCLFIDAHQLKGSQEEPLSWKLGKVIDVVSEIKEKLGQAFVDHEHIYNVVQNEQIEAMFHKDISSPSELAANAIVNLYS